LPSLAALPLTAMPAAGPKQKLTPGVNKACAAALAGAIGLVGPETIDRTGGWRRGLGGRLLKTPIKPAEYQK